MSGPTLTVIRGRLERDLPVAWDGAPVTWGEPTAVGAVFICPPSKDGPEACPKCGVLYVDGADAYTGYVAGEPEPARWIRHHLTGKPVKRPGWETRHMKLALTRCLSCGHDQVLDLDTDELWDLDDSDYGPEGSVPPAPETLF